MTQATYDEFVDAYNRWLDDCLVEFNQHYASIYGSRTMHTATDDYNPGRLVEFSEDGDAYPHSHSGTGHVRRAVTPWSESQYFIE